MTGPVWYYAQGDTEKGPLTTAQIKALAAAGKIRGDDFVWKQGMESWVPARDASDLVLPETTDRVEIHTVAGQTQRVSRRTPAELAAAGALPRFGRALVATGFLAVLLVRGCDSLALRNIQRLEAIPLASQRLFDEAWQSQRRSLESELRAAAAGDATARADQTALQQEIETLDQLNQSRKEQLVAGLWQQQQFAAQQAETDNQIWGYWREVAFLIGAVSLAVGLLLLVFSAQGPDRWLGLGVLAALVYAVFTAGHW